MGASISLGESGISVPANLESELAALELSGQPQQASNKQSNHARFRKEIKTILLIQPAK